MKSTHYQICNPASKKHRTAMMWFASMTNALETHPQRGTASAHSTLQRSVECYSMFAETGDDRYLRLCEDFLQASLTRALP